MASAASASCASFPLPFAKPLLPLLPLRRATLALSTFAASPDSTLNLSSAATQGKPIIVQDDIFLDLASALAVSDPKVPPFASSELQISLSELIEQSGIKPLSVSGDLGTPVAGIQNDSRKVSPGDLFVCCVGRKTDGHRFVADAVARGAVAVVVAGKGVDFNDFSGCRAVVAVENTNKVIAALGASFFRRPSEKMKVVGITGTNGKTTTAHLVKGIYEATGTKTGMLGTVGYFGGGEKQLEVPNTTPDAVEAQRIMAKMARNGTAAVVMEASSHGLAQRRCDEIDFDVAVFTNLTRDHYDFHLTEGEYRNSKAKLFDKMLEPRRHRKVINLDDPNAAFFAARGNVDVPVVTYAAENKDADVYALRFEVSMFGTWLLVCTPKGVVEISSGLLGRHNVCNILAAVAVGIAVDASLEDIVRGIEGVSGVPGRCELIQGGQSFVVMVDFAHTPDALARVLDMAKELGARRIITVFGCAGESDRGKRPIMTKIATDKSDVVILTTDNPKTENPYILSDMLAGVGWTMRSYVDYGKNDYYPPLPNGHKLFVHDMRRVAVRAAIAMAEKGDIVIVAGRGHETYQQEGERKRYINDREECRDALHYVDKLHRAAIDKQIPMVVTKESLISFCKDVEAWFIHTDQNCSNTLPVY